MIGGLDELKSSLNNTINSTQNNKLKSNIDGSIKTINTLKKAMNFGAIYIGLRKGLSIAKDIGTEYVDMIETNNLFEVSLGKVVDQYGNLDKVQSQYYTQGIKFQNEMNEKLATNKKELMEYQSMYFSMFNSQLGTENKDKSYFMSEQLTKAGYDIASLYNLSVSDAMNKIKSGIAGQVESLRTIGIDVSESSLTKVLNDVGIDRSVQKLSYAEKEVARYIAIVEQAKQAQGDFAKTFEQPANQIKVFQNQLAELKQVAGSFIINTFGNILVYVNAIIMALKEILKSFANLFGYDLNTGGADLSTATGIDDLDKGLGSATKKAKELKKQLMGFDEINNIDPASKTSGSGSSGIATGVDDKLLNALKEWDNKMSSISGKAQEIRDKMLDWLGFTRDVNGNLKWAWKDMSSIAKVVSIIAGIIGGIYIIGKITKLVNWLKSLVTILKTGKGATTTFGMGLQTIGKASNSVKKFLGNLVTTTKLGIEQFKIFRKSGDSVTTALGKTGNAIWGLIPKWVKLTGGIAGTVASTVEAYKASKDLAEGTTTSEKAVLKLSGAMGGAAASGIMLSSAIGGALGAVAGLASPALAGYAAMIAYTFTLNDTISTTKNSIKTLSEEVETLKNKYDESIKSILSKRDASLHELETIKELRQELLELVDSNGKVIEGKETLAKYILGELSEALGEDFQLTGNQISVNGELIKSYDELASSIDEYISQQEKKIRAEAYEEIYKETLKQKIELQKKYNEAYEDYFNALNDVQKATFDAKNSTSALERAQASWNKTVAEGNLKQAKEQINDLGQELSDVETKLQEAKEGFSDTYNSMNDTVKTTGTEILNTTSSTFNSMRDYVIKYSPQIVDEYDNLGENSENAYTDNIEKIPEETKEVISKSAVEIKRNAPNVVSEASCLASQIEGTLNNIDTTEAGRQAVNGVAQGIDKNKNNNSLWNSIKSLKDVVVNSFKKAFDIHSPSKLMADLAQYIPSGIAEGIEDNTYQAVKSAKDMATKVSDATSANLNIGTFKELGNGIKISTNDFAVDTNQYIDYGAIRGQVQAQSNISMSSNIIQDIVQAIKEGMSESEVNVSIEAKTDEGTIVKKASQGFKDYVMQTGELPFPVPV